VTGIIPPQVVTPPEPRALRYGLLTAANGPLSLPAPHGLAGGVTYTPVGCGQTHVWPNLCHDNEVFNTRGDVQMEIGLRKTFDAEADLVERDSFIVYASLTCGSAGTTWEELDAKVRRRLADGEQTSAETGLATLLTAGATALPYVGVELTDVVAELEQYLYGSAGFGYGYVGYLHAPPRMVAYAAEEGLVVRDGPLLKTPAGTVWVFGGGYPDDGTITISGQVTVWRSDDVFVTPAGSALNQRTNQYNMLAEREYVVSYDCAAASAVFDWQPIS
jgi:hypothetical protein